MYAAAAFIISSAVIVTPLTVTVPSSSCARQKAGLFSSSGVIVTFIPLSSVKLAELSSSSVVEFAAFANTPERSTSTTTSAVSPPSIVRATTRSSA